MRWMLLAILAASLGGCAFVYRDTVVPLDVNFNKTPVLTDRHDRGRGDVKQINFYVDVEWDSNAIGDIARREGLETVYYADIETIAVLGIWTQQIVHVYGK